MRKPVHDTPPRRQDVGRPINGDTGGMSACAGADHPTSRRSSVIVESRIAIGGPCGEKIRTQTESESIKQIPRIYAVFLYLQDTAVGVAHTLQRTGSLCEYIWHMNVQEKLARLPQARLRQCRIQKAFHIFFQYL